MQTAPGAFHWNELMTRDLERSKAFYAKVCGWTYEAMPMPEGLVYTIIMSGEQPVGGMFPMSGDEFEGVDEQWVGYIAVEDADKAADAASAGGGKVEKPPFDIEGVGRIAVLTDPSGAIIGVIKPAPPAPMQTG